MPLNEQYLYHTVMSSFHFLFSFYNTILLKLLNKSILRKTCITIMHIRMSILYILQTEKDR